MNSFNGKRVIYKSFVIAGQKVIFLLHFPRNEHHGRMVFRIYFHTFVQAISQQPHPVGRIIVVHFSVDLLRIDPISQQFTHRLKSLRIRNIIIERARIGHNPAEDRFCNVFIHVFLVTHGFHHMKYKFGGR